MRSLAETRPNYIDYAKAIAIYCVVLGHYTYAFDFSYEPSPIWSAMHMITLFHMPFFFFVSGMLYKKIKVKSAISKGWIQLLKPYLIMSALVSVIMLIEQSYTDGLNIKYMAKVAIGIFSANDFPFAVRNWSSPLWFCYSLFIIKVVYSFLFNRSWGGYFIIILCLLGVAMMYIGNKFPLRIDSSLVGFVFFTIGAKGSEVLESFIDSSSKIKIFTLLFALFVLSISAYFNLNLHQRQGLSINAMYFGKYPFLFLVSGISGTAVLLLLSSFLCRIKYKMVLTISNGTIVVLGFHWTIYKLAISWWFSSYSVLIAMVVALIDLMICYCLILVFNRYLPSVLGNRKLN